MHDKHATTKQRFTRVPGLRRQPRSWATRKVDSRSAMLLNNPGWSASVLPPSERPTGCSSRPWPPSRLPRTQGMQVHAGAPASSRSACSSITSRAVWAASSTTLAAATPTTPPTSQRYTAEVAPVPRSESSRTSLPRQASCGGNDAPYCVHHGRPRVGLRPLNRQMYWFNKTNNKQRHGTRRPRRSNKELCALSAARKHKQQPQQSLHVLKMLICAAHVCTSMLLSRVRGGAISSPTAVP